MSVLNKIVVLGCCFLTTSSGLSVHVKHDQHIRKTTALFDAPTSSAMNASTRFESEWVPITSLNFERAAFGISKMNDGSVFVSQGFKSPGVEWLTSELYKDGIWTDVHHYIDRSLSRALFGQYTNSTNGDVFAVGGISYDNTRKPNTIKYDSISKSWTAVSDVPQFGTARSAHGLAVLQNGSVVVIGGQTVSTSTLDSGEIWDAGDMSWRPIEPMDRQRAHFCTGVLQDGKVIVVGGNNSADTMSSVYLWDSERNVWEAGPDLQQARAGCALTVLNNGSVVVAGGATDGVTPFESAEIYHPTGVNKRWETFHPMGTARVSFGLITLNNGSIIATGGYGSRGVALASSEMWTPPTPTPSPPSPTPPGNLYRCLHDACVADTSGVGLKECEDFCGVNEYRCEEDKCVRDVRGMNHSLCNAICGPPSKKP